MRSTIAIPSFRGVNAPRDKCTENDTSSGTITSMWYGLRPDGQITRVQIVIIISIRVVEGYAENADE